MFLTRAAIIAGVLCFLIFNIHQKGICQSSESVDVLPFSKGIFNPVIFPADDGGIFIVGAYLNLLGQVDRQHPLLIKYDSCHNYAWSQIYLSAYPFLEVTDAIRMKNGNLAICGYMYGGSNYDSYILVLDKLGNPLSFNKFYTEKNEICYSIDQLASGDVFLYLNHTPVSGGPSRNVIILFDANFNIKWQRSFNKIGIWGNAIACSDNSILARAGNVIFRVSDEADLLFNKTFSPSMTNSIEPVELSNGYVFTHKDNSSPDGRLMMKLSKSGEVIWSRKMFDMVDKGRLRSLSNDSFRLLNSRHDGSSEKAVFLTMDSNGNPSKNSLITWIPRDYSFALIDELNWVNNSSFYAGLSNNQLVLIKSEHDLSEDCFDDFPGIDLEEFIIESSEYNFEIFETDIIHSTMNIEVQSFDIIPERFCESTLMTTDKIIDTTFCFGTEIQLIGPPINASFMWDDGTESSIRVVRRPGRYILYIDICGNQFEWEFTVDVENCPCTIEIPNAFTPNGDGHNDIFNVVGDCNYQSYELKIFNRWGQMIYSSQNVEQGWNGDVNGRKSPSEVYIYTLNYSYYDHEDLIVQESKGDLTLIR